jgi:hypothetical protein
MNNCLLPAEGHLPLSRRSRLEVAAQPQTFRSAENQGSTTVAAQVVVFRLLAPSIAGQGHDGDSDGVRQRA